MNGGKGLRAFEARRSAAPHLPRTVASFRTWRVKRRPRAQCLASKARSGKIAEREGFEPSVPLRVHATSNRAPSAARSSLQRKRNHVIARTSNARGDEGARASGEGGIRTPETNEGLTVFETARFSRSRTSPKKPEARRIRTADLQIRNLKLYPAEL